MVGFFNQRGSQNVKLEKANVRNNRIELFNHMVHFYYDCDQHCGNLFVGCICDMKKIRLELAKLLAGKENIVAPAVPTDRMRIVFLGQLSNGALYPEAYRVMMINSPNYKHD